MIPLIDPSVFWSDIVLGIVALCIPYTLKLTLFKKDYFLALAISTWLGAFYHGFYNSTASIGGELLWTATMAIFGLSSIFIILSLQNVKTFNKKIILLYAVYLIVIVCISEKFIIGIGIQAIAILLLGFNIIRKLVRDSSRTQKLLLLNYIVFIIISILAVLIQQKFIIINSINNNTLFHLIQIPAIIIFGYVLKQNERFN